MPTIRCLGIDPIQLPHSFREISVRGLNHQVVVITHLAIGMVCPVECSDNLAEDLQKLYPVRIVFIGGFPAVSSGGDVIECTCEFDSHGPCHGLELARI